jgi:CrcB protein
MRQFLTYLAVGLGAGLGGMCRYAMGAALLARFGPGFPWGTFTINVSGSFLIGLIAELAQTRAIGIDPLLRVLLTAGFLGGYTTFSSFSFETVTLANERDWKLSLAYGVGSLVLGIAACYLGMVAARLLGIPKVWFSFYLRR